MRVLSVTAQKPCSTGSGVYLTEVVRSLAKMGVSQAVVAGVTREDRVDMPEGVTVYPVYFSSEKLPYPVVGMSDEMPYTSTRYRDMTEEMAGQFKAAFLEVLDEAIEKENPDIILCHHLYYLTALIRAHYPAKKVYGFCHNTDLRQMESILFERNFIRQEIPKLDRIFALQEAQKEKIKKIYPVSEKQMTVIGTGYNSEVFKKTGIKLSRKDGKIRMIFAGKITQKKGVKSLLRALKQNCGGSRRATPDGCRYPVVFAGCVTQSRLAELYNDCDIFVLPSMYEGLPLTVIESLACGDRVVMTKLEGIAEWLADMVPDADIRYVLPPGMKGTDEPLEEELPAFESRLAEALREAIEEKDTKECDVSRISWKKIAREVIR